MELGILLYLICRTIMAIVIIAGLIISLYAWIYTFTHWREVVNNECIPFWEKQEKKAEKKRLKAERKARIEAQRWWYQ